MVALYPRPEVARKLAVPGGEAPEDLHLTLCYLGKAADFDPTALLNLPGRIGEVAARCAALEGSISGWGCFSPSERTEGQEVLWAAVDVPGLTELRGDLAKVCAEMGAPPVDAHSYQPHITLAYREPGSGKVPALDRIPIWFDSVFFVSGEQRIQIPLSAPAAQVMERGSAEPPVGVWDAVCTFGQYQHETINGKPCVTVHDASTCKAMLDDFAAHPLCDIFYDKQHEVVDELGDDALDRDKMLAWGQGDGHALAWANALIMIVGGQVARYEPHPGAPPDPPSAEQVLRQSDGTMRPDGVYCLRSVVTPRGADPIGGLSAFRQTSPYFVGEKDGNRLLCLTVTNDARMRDCALAYQRGGAVAMQRVPARAAQRSSMEMPMATKKMEEDKGGKSPETAAVMAAAGCAEEDSAEVKVAKLAGYARKMEDEVGQAAARKMEDDSKGEEAAEKSAKAASRKMDAAPLAGTESPEEEAKEHAALVERIEALEEKNAMLLKELADSRGAMKRFAAMEEKTKAQEAAAFARGAVAMGRIKGDHKGSVEATEKWLADRYIKSAADAEDLLSAEGTFQVSELVAMTRYTTSGAGIGAPHPREGLSASDEVDALIAAEIKALQASGEKGDLTSVAMSRVSKKHPAAWSRYVNRNRA